MHHPRINPLLMMPITKPSLMNANLKRFMGKPKFRIEEAQSLDDLLSHTSYGVRCHVGKLSVKIENGCLVNHRYTQGKKES
ncbi:hypothetical protein VCRA2128O305_170046 [Vibrio crassostreae]|nr:hypothetical protein VCRA2116O233_150045 [Vibrio crassostreae]CAK1793999.1 hypothetical protein VCRA2113O206_170088 [Vibrio crassostreae]CAK1798094.1 hypothetical protein VCRA2110O175_170088 [Vibrio crassostreae]CAK2593103.1 hypothetical protein VCRA2119O244_160039 [Vibrio crassostreae]CAK2716616.1 hypothetical protein VCRA2133O313_160039 [Vibrio crassostreae]